MYRKGEFVTVVTVGLQVCQKCDKRVKVIVIFGDKKLLTLLYTTGIFLHVVTKTTAALAFFSQNLTIHVNSFEEPHL